MRSRPTWTRAVCREELGVEPAEPLQHLHQQILAADPALAAAAGPAAGPAGEPAARDDAAARDGAAPRDGAAGRDDAGARDGPGTLRQPLPAQLPHRIPDFTGRDAELRRLDALVTRDDPGRPSSSR